LATAGFNVAVDADGLFGGPSIPGFNEVKTQSAYRTQSIQPLIVAWRKPQALILGASRMGVGMRAGFFPWNQQLDVYDAAVEGAGIYMELRMYQHAQAVSDGGVEKALISLGFMGFNEYYDKSNPNWIFMPDFNSGIATYPDGRDKPLYLLHL